MFSLVESLLCYLKKTFFSSQNGRVMRSALKTEAYSELCQTPAEAVNYFRKTLYLRCMTVFENASVMFAVTVIFGIETVKLFIGLFAVLSRHFETNENVK